MFICAFVPLYMGVFVHLYLYIHPFDVRQAPCWDDPLNITPRWARRKLTTGQQSHRRSRPMFMFNPDLTSNVQMCKCANVQCRNSPSLVEGVQILCHLCSRGHQLVRHKSDPMSDQMSRLPIKFAIKPAQHEVTLHVHAYIISHRYDGTKTISHGTGRFKNIVDTSHVIPECSLRCS